jgi:hypothetical protein
MIWLDEHPDGKRVIGSIKHACSSLESSDEPGSLVEYRVRIVVHGVKSFRLFAYIWCDVKSYALVVGR